MEQTKTVQFVVNSQMCTACGGCSGLCPEDAITMEINPYGIFTPNINKKKCIECGICVEVCPGHEFNYWEFQERIFRTKNIDPVIGHYIETWAGQTTDHDVHLKAQSGGLVSTMLMYCLENGLADGAVVTRWSRNDPFKPEVYLARDQSEILDAVGSKYNPIPLGTIIKELLIDDGRFIVVGTSCQIHTFRKAEKIYPQLSEKIILYLGLHCAKVFNFHYHDQIVFKVRETKNNIINFGFRDKLWRGWPCDMKLVNKTGKVYNLSGSFSRAWPRSFFSNYRCQFCFDKLNEFSDISCGDCRIASAYGKKTLNEVLYNNLGKSDIVIRTKRGKVLFDKIAHDGYLHVNPTEKKDLIRTVKVAEKKLGVNDFCLFAKLFGMAYPSYGVRFVLSDSKDRIIDAIVKPWSVIASAHYYICHVCIKHSLYRGVLKRVPHWLMYIISSVRELPVSHIIFRKTAEIEARKLEEH